MDYVYRTVEKKIQYYLSIFPAVLITGPRQCGKSTLVKHISSVLKDFVYVDLQNRTDLQKISEPELFFQYNREKTVCMDEIQIKPELFSILRSEIDIDRRAGRFVLLGSASAKIMQRSSETLAGRVGIIDLTPFTVEEVCMLPGFSLEDFWLKGGFPDSFLANNADISAVWRENFIRTYIERDIPNLGIKVESNNLIRCLTMIANSNGQVFNESKLAASLGISHPTVKRYTDLFNETFVVRILQPYYENIKKRLVKSPKLYIRDTGILHEILNIDTINSLLGNNIAGSSWEGLVVENICCCCSQFMPYYYRDLSGQEIDLILVKGDYKIAVECKLSKAPKLTVGFWNCIDNLQIDKAFVVAPIDEDYKLKDNVEVCSLLSAIRKINDLSVVVKN